MFTNLTALDWTEVVIEPGIHFLNYALKIDWCLPGIENHMALVFRGCAEQAHQRLLIRFHGDDVIVMARNQQRGNMVARFTSSTSGGGMSGDSPPDSSTLALNRPSTSVKIGPQNAPTLKP